MKLAFMCAAALFANDHDFLVFFLQGLCPIKKVLICP